MKETVFYSKHESATETEGMSESLGLNSSMTHRGLDIPVCVFRCVNVRAYVVHGKTSVKKCI